MNSASYIPNSNELRLGHKRTYLSFVVSILCRHCLSICNDFLSDIVAGSNDVVNDKKTRSAGSFIIINDPPEDPTGS